MSAGETPTGYVDARAWPDRLVAHVVTPAPPHRIHGYDVESDLARRHGLPELLLLVLTGELPEPARARAFEAALAIAAPVPIQHAPAHAARLAHVSGAPPSAVIATAAVALAESAREELDAHAPWLEWLRGGAGPEPPATPGPPGAPSAHVESLRGACAFPVPGLDRQPGPTAAVLAALHACGLNERWQLEAALVLARLAPVVAEAVAVPRAGLQEHPINLPRFDYVEARRDE